MGSLGVSPGGVAQGGGPWGVGVQVGGFFESALSGGPRGTPGVLGGCPQWPHTFLQLAQLHPDYVHGFLQRHLKGLWGFPDVQVRQCALPLIPISPPQTPQIPSTPYIHRGIQYIPKYSLNLPPQKLYTLKPIYPQDSPSIPLPTSIYPVFHHTSHSRPPCPIPHDPTPSHVPRALLTHVLLLLQKMQGIHDDLLKCLTLPRPWDQYRDTGTSTGLGLEVQGWEGPVRAGGFRGFLES